MRAQARTGADPLRAELRGLLGTIRTARPELEQSALPARAAKLAVLLDLLERRIEALAEAAPAPAPPGEAARLTVVPPPDEPELPIPTPAAAQPALALAHERPAPPLPAGTSPTHASAAIIPEVSWFDSAPAAATEIESGLATPETVETAQANAPPPITEIAETRMPPPVEAVIADPVAQEPTAREPVPAPLVEQEALPQPDPLAALMALSEAERIALFT